MKAEDVRAKTESELKDHVLELVKVLVQIFLFSCTLPVPWSLFAAARALRGDPAVAYVSFNICLPSRLWRFVHTPKAW